MKFFWVNLGDTYREVLNHGFLWAPSKSIGNDGTEHVNAGWKAVPEVKKGDVIFCNVDQELLYIAVAKQDAFLAERPATRSFKKWAQDGFQVNVELSVLPEKIHVKEFVAEFSLLYNDQCSPKVFTKNNTVCQIYMARLPASAGLMLFGLTDRSVMFDIGEKSVETQNPRKGGSTKKATTNVRDGQSDFRKRVLAYWNKTCPVTGVNKPGLLVASHIVPWVLSDPAEKVDTFNGIALSPNADKLFDKGLMSFTDSGMLIVHNSISNELLERLGIPPTLVVSGLTSSHRVYLARHRDLHGFAN